MVHCMHAYSPCSDTNYCVLCLSITQIGDNQQPAHGCLQEGQGVGGGHLPILLFVHVRHEQIFRAISMLFTSCCVAPPKRLSALHDWLIQMNE